MTTRRNRLSFAFTGFLLFVPLGSVPAPAQDLGSARLQIAGTQLTVSPATQTVPLDTPTLVETHLSGYDPARGVLPGDLRVVADLSGPGLGALRLESAPNEPLRIPALRTKGEYFLENIRLIQGEELLAYAEPRTASVLVTQLLISSVSTRALTEDEIRNYGIVIDDDSRQAINLSFAFGVEGSQVEYSMPVVFRHFGPEDWGRPAEIMLPEFSGQTVNMPRFSPPRPVPFKIEMSRDETTEIVPYGGCDLRAGCRQLEPPEPPMVGVIFFPTEMSLLHQFFSVMLMVQNGAPDGDLLTVSDLTARIQVPSGLRQAETVPPTPLGVPVPVRVPGADGEVGTSDDLTLLVAQATAQAEFLVEGLQQGTHIVEFDMEGMLHGMPSGPRRITGEARGAVTVRDPTLSATIQHPTVVRENFEYTTTFTVSNLGNQPVNGIEIALPSSGLAGTRLADGETYGKSLGSLLPGESESVSFRMLSLISGKVVATSTRAGSGVSPLFEFSVGIGDGIPLAPESLALPTDIDALPEELIIPAQKMLGVAHSLSTAPWELVRGKPQVTRRDVNERAYRLVQAGRIHGLGEPLFESVSVLSAEWAGGRDRSWEWDELRRSMDSALEMSEYVGATLRVTEPDPVAAMERFATATHFLNPWTALSRHGEIEVASRVTGKSAHGFLGEAVRDLPFTELIPLDDADLAFVAVPEEEGHRVTVRRQASGGADLHLVLPASTPGGPLRVITWHAISLDAGGSAWVDVVDDGSSLDLNVDGDADGEADLIVPGSESILPARPFEAVAVRQNRDIDPSGHVVDVLFSADVALDSLIPRRADRFVVPGRVSNGGITPREVSMGGGLLGQPAVENPFEGLANPRIVRVVFNNPLGPFEQHVLTVGDLESSSGDLLTTQDIEVETTVDQPGIRLEGTILDSYGKPLPGAEVQLREADQTGHGPSIQCEYHPTAVTRADEEGRYTFDYVRQTECSDVFKVIARSPGEPRWGEASGRVRFVNQTQQLNVVMVGRGVLEGKVTYEDGSAPVGLRVIAHNPVLDTGREAWTDDEGNYRMAEVSVGTVSLVAFDELGNRVYQTLEMPTAGARIERDLTILRRVEDESTGTVRGHAVDESTGEPEAGAYVALYVNEVFIGSLTADYDGSFDFGTVPTGLVELVAFDGLGGLRGAQLFFELAADQVADQELRLASDRGTIEGYVYRVDAYDTTTPVEGAVVWLRGLPEHTVTDENGYYRLVDIPLGTRSVRAADLENQVETISNVTLDSTTDAARADLYFRDEETRSGALQGTVLDRDGQPVQNAVIHLAGGYYSVRWHHEAFTDANGRFRIDGLGSGVYGIHAMDGADGAIGWGEIRFPGDVDDVTIQFKGGDLRGRTFYTAPDGQRVGVASTLYYQHVEVLRAYGVVALSSDWKQLVTEADGTFSIPALYGPYEIIAHNAFHGRRESAGQFDQFTEEIEFEFDLNGSLGGTVYMPDGETPAVGADVTLRGGQISEFTVQTDEEGNFFFDLLPQAGYHLTIHHELGTIFRQDRVWARIKTPGEILDIDIVLPEQGAVEGWVEDADGQRVGNAIVELSERAFPWRRIRQTTDGEGSYSFTNIFVGEFSLSATAPELGGLGVRSRGEITSEGQEVQTVLTLQGTGSLFGRVWSPDTGDVVANARVRLQSTNVSSSFFDANTSSIDGEYTFDKLPFGSYRIAVFDPTTGRHGRGEWVDVAFHGEEVTADVTLEVRGTVDGHLYDPPSNATIPGQTIQLNSSGLRWFKTFSSTDVEGYFTFEGIPEGDFEVKTAVDGRRAQAFGEILEEDEVVTRDLYLETLAKITGVVLGPRQANGSFGEAVDQVNVLVRQGSVVAAGTENPFSFEDLLARRLRVEAYEIGGDHQTRLNVRPRSGETTEVELVMRALGSATVQVLSSTGEPVPNAQVTLDNSYSTYTGHDPANLHGTSMERRSKTADDLGVVRFNDQWEGTLRASAVDPVTGLAGSASALLTYEEQEVQLTVSLQPSGTIQGTVLMPDGVTPGVAMTVALEPPGQDWTIIETDELGQFVFESIPLGSYQLIAQEPDGLGSHSVSGILQADLQVDEHVLVLDEHDPYVVSMTPINMSRDQPIGSQVVLTFNEPLRRCSSCSSWFRFEKLDGHRPPVTVQWSADDTVVTLIPDSPLSSSTTYRIRVFDNAVDTAGRRLDPAFVGGFTTADVIPPKVVRVDPKPDTVQVAKETGVTLQFSEPVDLESLSGAFQVTDLTTGQALTVTTLPRLDAMGVALTPVAGFAADRKIEVRANGMRDPSGNVQTVEFTSVFWTVDETPPVVQWQRPSASQSFVAGDAINLEATVADNRGVARVRFTLGEWTSGWLPAQSAPSSPDEGSAETFGYQLPAPFMEAPGEVIVQLVAEDIWGNVADSEVSVFVEPLNNEIPPAVNASCPADADFVAPGLPLETTLAVADDLAVESVWLEVDGERVSVQTPIAVSESLAVLAWTPDTEALPGQVFALEYFVRDFAGNVTSRSQIAQVPTVSVVSAGDELTGSHLFLAQGDHSLAADLAADTITVLDGASWIADIGTLVSAGTSLELQCGSLSYLSSIDAPSVRVETGATLRVLRADTMHISAQVVEVEVDGRIDGVGRGSLAWQAPDGVPAASRAGASHGGWGSERHSYSSYQTVYDSVYVPHMVGAGAGGSFNTHSERGGDGGGAVDVRADEVILEGEINVRGREGFEQEPWVGDGGGGAGGTVMIDTAELRGFGSIEARGGESHCAGGGGGGRVAIHAGVLDFDPASQISAPGGRRHCDSSWPGGPGTVFYRTPERPYGVLRFENQTGGAPMSGTGATPLPTLGSSSVQASQSEATDRWIFGPADFDAAWLGAWMRLEDAAGFELGTFRVLELDGTRVRLEGAAAVTGAATYRGVYRFDEIHGMAAQLDSDDVLEVTGGLTVAGRMVVDTPFEASSFDVVTDSEVLLGHPLNVSGDVVIGSGSIVRPIAKEAIEITAGGRLVLEEGAHIDTDGRGHFHDAWGEQQAEAPEGIRPASGEGGGSHGGRGGSSDGVAAEIYDSVYLPIQAGGGGGYGGSDGGGVVVLTADDLVVDGLVSARSTAASPAGAGGTIRLHARSLSGAGLLDASANLAASRRGGGGRIAIWSDELADFDPAQQTRAWSTWSYEDTAVESRAAAGTVFVHTADSDYGALRIDNGLDIDGSHRPAAPTTLPLLGDGVPAGISAEGADLRIDLGEIALRRWVGAYVVLSDGVGELGTYRVASTDGQTILLEGAASLASQVQSYRGVYRFDSLEVVHGAQLLGYEPDGLEELVFDTETLVAGVLRARKIHLGPRALLRPEGRQPVQLIADDEIHIEAGAVIDAFATGFEGFGTYGTAPAGIEAAGDESGGSHGGRGFGSNPGEVYGSVYSPSQAGASGSNYGHGGGVILLAAPTVRMDGRLIASGDGGSGQSNLGNGGAGGTVRIEAQSFSGSGQILASGAVDGDQLDGGGGRVALWVGSLGGFDPETQIETTGGRAGEEWAAAGTIFVRTDASTYGDLYLDSRDLDERDPADGLLRKALQTELPQLGSGTPTALSADGDDLLLDLGTTAFERWRRAWIRLLAADGSELGTYEVTDIEASILRIQAAAAHLADVASYEGSYRFDRVVLDGGAGLETFDPAYADEMRFRSHADLAGDWSGEFVVAETGSTVQPVRFDPLVFEVGTSIEVEPGARLDVTRHGFHDRENRAPENVDSPAEKASHGGLADHSSGEIYDSVYFPRWAGARAWDGHPGGGVLRLSAPSITVDGVLDASGSSSNGDDSAGGTIRIDAQNLEGSGSILVRGGDGDGAGGGRVAIRVAQSLDFDVRQQVSTAGGSGSVSTRGGPGTVYLYGPDSVWGSAFIDNENTSLSPDQQTVTPLPVVGTGSVGVAEPDADRPADLWVEPADPETRFDLGVEGMWMRIGGVDYRILDELISRRRVLLEGASGLVQVGDEYRGVYKFDELHIERMSSIRIDDASEIGVLTVDEYSLLESASYEIDLTITSTALEVAESSPLQIDATFSDQEPGQTHTATVDWGDGTVEAGILTDGDIGSVTGTHTWAQDGSYIVEICVVEEGREGCDQVEVTVTEVAPDVTLVRPETYEGWQQDDSPNGVYGSQPGIWVIETAQPVTLRQATGSAPSVFVGPDSAANWVWTGSLKRGYGGAGFGLVLGFEPGDAIGREETDYLLLAWMDGNHLGKQQGLRLYRIRGASDFWTFQEPTTELLAEAATLSQTSARGNVEEHFELRLSESRLQFFVEGGLEFDLELDLSSYLEHDLGVWTQDADESRFVGFTRTERIVDVGRSIQLDGLFSDVGEFDVHTATVDWGDGTALESASVTESSGAGTYVTPWHAYDTVGSYAATVCVSDETLQGCASIPVTVTNFSPRVTATSGVVDFGDSTPMELATFFDTVTGSFTATVDWNGAGPQPTSVEMIGEADGRVFVVPPASVGLQVGEICVTDFQGGVGCDVTELTVEAVNPPAIASVTASGVEGGTTTLVASFTDADVGETHTATVDWGAGPIPATVDQQAMIFTSQTDFGDSGSHPVTVCIADTLVEICQAATAEVANVAPVVSDYGLGPMDHSARVEESFTPGNGWSVSADGLIVDQSSNVLSTFYHGGDHIAGWRIAGSVRANGDDDFLGLALGFLAGDTATRPETDYLLLQWKRLDQSGALKGLRLFRVLGEGDLWSYSTDDPLKVPLAAGSTLGNSGWVSGHEYAFEIELSESHLRIWVDGSLEFDLDVEYSDGTLTFWTSAQSATFSNFSAVGRVVDEGSLLTISGGTFSDAGLQDSHTGFVDWGDGVVEPTTAGGDGAAGTLDGRSHVYLDDLEATLRLCAVDDDGGEGCGLIPITVFNVAPVVTTPETVSLSESSDVELATYVDAGSADSHSATIDWGDGSPAEPATVEVLAPGQGRVLGNHAYATPSLYTAEICVADDDGGSSCATTTVSAADSVVPTVSVSGVASEYAAAEALTATITTYDEVGVERVEIAFDGALTILTEGQDGVFTYQTQVDPSLTGPRTTSLDIVAFDYAGNASTQFTQSIDLVLDQPPVMSVTLDPGTTVEPGDLFTVTVDYSDDVSVETLDFAISGDYADAATRAVGVASGTETWQTSLPTTIDDQSTLLVTVEAIDSFGHVATYQQALTVNADGTPPDLTLTLTPQTPGDRYSAGDVVTITASATDGVEVASLALTVDGETITGASPLEVVWTAPAIASQTTVEVSAEASDAAGNIAQAGRTLTISPSSNQVAPEVAFACPTDGAMLPSAYDLTLQFVAADDENLSHVELYRDDETTPLATLTPSSGGQTVFDASHIVTLPTVSGAGQQVRFRAVVFDTALNSSSQEITVDVVETVELDAGGANDWTSLGSSVAVLRSGTLEIDEPRTLGGLIVLPGASITHSHSAPGAEKALDLTVSGPAYIACGGALDVSEKGYPGETTYPGEIAAGNGSGGSHMGVGGQYGTSPTGSTYGSIYFPLEAGGGGDHYNSSNSGRRGGGVLTVEAAEMVLDGVILANGGSMPSGGHRGGAGGSIWLDVSGTVTGTGRMEAKGGYVGAHGAGGGGAIAVHHGGLAAGLEANLLAQGGATVIEGGAGTVYLHGPTSTYGDLIVDAGSVLDGVVDLPSLGSGVAESSSSGSLLETGLTSIQPYFVGHWVEIYDASGALAGTWRVASIDGGALVLSTGASVEPGDLWQGVYRFDDVALRGDLDLRSADPIRFSGEQEISGEVETDRITGHDLVLRAGTTLTHPATTNSSNPRRLEISLNGRLTIEAGAVIDASEKGYSGSQTYPGELIPGNGSGGSHLGVGGRYDGNAAGSTYGSVYFPAEPGAGGQNSSWGLQGGGVVFVEASELVLDGAIRANGRWWPTGGYRGGAGGSIWIDVSGTVTGTGTVEVRGGDVAAYGAGGGGAIAIHHSGLSGAVGSNLLAYGGATVDEGGAGTVYLHGPTSTYGDLIVDAGTVSDGVVDLPSLGSGMAESGSSGTRLETGLTTIQPFFVGHWVEIYDASGALEGTWRVASIDGGALVLAMGASVEPGDLWQGVYRFDDVDLRGDLDLRSADPIRFSGEQEISGEVETDLITGHDLVLRAGATLTHPATTSSSNPQRLEISLDGRLTIEAGAVIDVSEKGYSGSQTYPGEVIPGNGSGGSHLGVGGRYDGNAAGSTYGSVYFPAEPGAGGQNSTYGLQGGGVVFLEASELVLDGAIRANGRWWSTGGYRGGAGGSIWLDVTGTVTGTGRMEAMGGYVASYGAGGGGAIAVYHGGLAAGLESSLLAQGGATVDEGGAGTVYLHGPASTYGDLIVDAASVLDGVVDLPSLGSGIAESGSSGNRLETGLASIQPYFVGHWVEIYDASGVPEGTWRVASIDGGALVLATGASVEPGDSWQGVYRFDDVDLRGDLDLRSADPIRFSGEQEISGEVETDLITGHDLVLRAGATLTHPATTSSSNPRRLEISLDGRLTIESGAAIDVSEKGYSGSQTYPGEVIPGNASGGSHLGVGGRYDGNAAGSTYGSVYFPAEPGAGGQNSTYGLQGGGVVFVEALELVLDGAIRANGRWWPTGGYRGGAGGSIWLDVSGAVTGTGSVEVRGGDVAAYGAGGGGAIAIYHEGLGGTLESNLLAYGGATVDEGGAGAIYLHGPTSTYGDLIVDNADIAGNWTELPALGVGIAQASSGFDVLATDLSSTIQPYFVGHWVEIYDGTTEAYEGVYRIAEILPDGLSVRLAPNGAGAPVVDEGDLWQGVYLFDNVLLTGDALSFHSDDPVIAVDTETILGAVSTRRIQAGDLTLGTDALLTHPPENGGGEGLEIVLTRDLSLSSGAFIDVSGQGYGPSGRHPSASAPGGGGGGSHLGLGGYAPGTTYGSVYFPWEHGGGGEHSISGGRGGGRVRISAHDLVFTDAISGIRSDGIQPAGLSARGGAGGSIWIDLSGQLVGDGMIEALGAESYTNNYGSGSGGSIAIYHQGTSGTALQNAKVWGGDNYREGGAGAIYVFGPASTDGDLTVRSAGTPGADTVLPSLGQGSALAGSSGAVLVTDRASAVPDYFLGHWVEISTSGGAVKGTFRILDIDGTAVVLDDDDGVLPSVDEGDLWRGVYRFDSITVQDATLTSSDGLFESGTEVTP